MYSHVLLYLFVGIYALTGFLSLAFGYRLVRWLLGLYGMILFGTLAGMLGSILLDHPLGILVCILAGAFAGGLLFFAIFKALLFLYAALVAGAITHALLSSLLPVPLDLLAALAMAVLAGLLLLKLLRPALILLTSLSGAVTLVSCIQTLMNLSQIDKPLSLEDWQTAATLAGGSPLWIGIAASAGIVFQFATTKNERASGSHKSKNKPVTDEVTSPYAFLHKPGEK